LHIATDRDSVFACPPVAQPAFAVVGNEVWDLKLGKPSEIQIAGPIGSRATCTVSDDGKFFAAETGDHNSKGCPMQVWSLQTGKPVASLSAGGNDRQVYFFAFAGPTVKENTRWLVVVGTNEQPQKPSDANKSRVDVWDLTAGKIHHSFVIANVAQSMVTISPDRRYLAIPSQDHVHVYDIHQGREVAVMKDPPNEAPIPVASKPPGSNSNPGNTDAALRARRFRIASGSFREYAFASGIAFSPDGRQLAATFGGLAGRLIIWDSSGRVSFDSIGRHIPSHFGPDRYNRALLWSPDGTKLLLGGQFLVDVKSGQILYDHPVGFAQEKLPIFLDNEHLLAPTGDDALDAIALPLADIKASLAAMQNPKVPAIIRPGQKVSVTFEIVGSARGDADKTRDELTKALSDTLTNAGLVVADDQPVVFHISFEEAAGETLEIYEKRNPFDFRGTDTGRKATEAKSKVTIELEAAGSLDPYWSQQIGGNSPRSLNGSVDDTSLRDAMIHNLAGQIHGLQIPSFVPDGGNIKPLPITAE
jgi:hypothetical protein